MFDDSATSPQENWRQPNVSMSNMSMETPHARMSASFHGVSGHSTWAGNRNKAGTGSAFKSSGFPQQYKQYGMVQGRGSGSKFGGYAGDLAYYPRSDLKARASGSKSGGANQAFSDFGDFGHQQQQQQMGRQNAQQGFPAQVSDISKLVLKPLAKYQRKCRKSQKFYIIFQWWCRNSMKC